MAAAAASASFSRRRLFSLLFCDRFHLPTSQGIVKLTRAIQTQIEGAPDKSEHDDSSAQPTSASVNVKVNYTASSSLKPSARHDLAIVFTCKVCETRSVKTISRESYEKGVVLTRCGGCNNVHLIADRLGWFGEPGSVEDLLAARGEEVMKGSADTLNLTLQDLLGNNSNSKSSP